ncbi:hypothetical protein TNIN_326331 [Trichonephila inaurata madagascariensis]|uniref:SEA domain-containing protein n=1 Tax=Trichonephila inaurata madagascariensis TaxID=2747483 RepID=A0A8X6XNI6_9ARAC|nr:hypothetical protein TNIN_326331 [Trichonephila inaurata madagascariensis]
MIVSKAFGSQHSPNRHVTHICGGGYSLHARLRLLLEFTQHKLFKLWCPRTPGTLCVVHTTEKRTGFSKTSMQAFESFSVRQESRWKSFHVQSSGLQGIPIRNAVNEMDNGHFLISVAGHPYGRRKRKHDKCRQPEFLLSIVLILPCIFNEDYEKSTSTYYRKVVGRVES